MGFDLTHVYGLTEVYGPATVCAKHDAWDALDIGDETVKSHVARLLSKLQVENRAQAIVQSLKRGLLSLDELM